MSQSAHVISADSVYQDLRFAVRTLLRDRVFACIVVLVLGLGVGANTAVFSVVNTILLRPLAFRDPDALVWFANNGGKGGLSAQTYTVAAFEEFRRHNRSFQDVTAYQTFFNSVQYKLVAIGDPLPLTGVEVAENFFPLLGVEPAIGRLFTRDECRSGGPAAVLLTDGFWQRQFAGDPGIVGRKIAINASPAASPGPFTVVGVLPTSFDFGSVFSPGMQADVFVPAYMDFWRTWGNTLAVLGRMRPGVSLAQAQAESDVLFPQLRAMHGEWWEDYRSTLFGLRERVSGKLNRTLYVLWSAVTLMLLIVCINVCSLLLARAVSRSKEFAMRTALGAGRMRLARQSVTEGLVLSGLGALLAVAFAWAITAYLARQTQVALPLLATVRLDGAALAWTAFAAVAVALIFGVVPAIRMSDAGLHATLKDGGSGVTRGGAYERLRSALVISEVALACVLLFGSGLLLRSFARLLDVDLGFSPANVAAIKVELNDGGDAGRRGAITRAILERVRAIPGVEAAGMSDMLPLDRNRSWGMAAKENANDNKQHGAFVYVVTPGYFDAMGIRLRSGRDVGWNDGSKSVGNAVVVNEAAARREWPGRDALGRTVVGIGNGEARVVGVIADVRESSLEEESSAQVYISMTQVTPEGAELVVRTRLPAETVAPAVIAAVKSVNPGQPRTRFRAIQQVVDHAVSPRRFLVFLVTAFAAFGLALASLGIYGVISYSVARESQEIGIRMALGASAARVQFRVMKRTLRLTMIGIAVGAAASVAASRAIATLLFGTAPTDPAVLAAVLAVLIGIALLAGQIPARRASRIDPAVVLRGW